MKISKTHHITRKGKVKRNPLKVAMVYRRPDNKAFVMSVVNRKGEGLFEFERRRHYVVIDRRGKQYYSGDDKETAIKAVKLV